DVGGVGSARGTGAVHADLSDALQQAVLEFVAQGRDAFCIVGKRGLGDFRGFAEAYDSGDVFRAGAESALVMAAIEKLTQASAVADVERADAFGGIKLVAGEGKQI